MGSLAAMYSPVEPSYMTRANSASSSLNISVPYSLYRGSSTSQSEPLLKVYFPDSCSLSFSKPYISPLQTT